MGDGDTIEQMIERVLADCRIGIAQGSEFVFLALKKIGIDRTGGDAAFAGEFLHLGHVFEAVRKIPKDVQGNRRAGSRELVHHPGVAEFLRQVGRCGGLHKFAEPGSCVRKPPRGQFDLELIERLPNRAFHVQCHSVPIRETVLNTLNSQGLMHCNRVIVSILNSDMSIIQIYQLLPQRGPDFQWGNMPATVREWQHAVLLRSNPKRISAGRQFISPLPSALLTRRIFLLLDTGSPSSENLSCWPGRNGILSSL
jgi:hypothetical protein